MSLVLFFPFFFLRPRDRLGLYPARRDHHVAYFRLTVSPSGVEVREGSIIRSFLLLGPAKNRAMLFSAPRNPCLSYDRSVDSGGEHRLFLCRVVASSLYPFFFPLTTTSIETDFSYTPFSTDRIVGGILSSPSSRLFFFLIFFVKRKRSSVVFPLMRG